MARMREVLLIDVDEGRRDALVSRLNLYDEFRSTQAATAADALELAGQERFDAVILEADLPDADAVALTRDLHAAQPTAAILVLCAPGSDRLMVDALEAGAIDCLPRSVSLPVLVARLRAHIRLGDRLDGAPMRLGPLVVWPHRRLITHAVTGARAGLTEKELGLLRSLDHMPGRLVSRARLLDEVWRMNRAVETHTVETHIYRLRQKIKTLAGNEVRIATEPNGYRLVIENAGTAPGFLAQREIAGDDDARR